MVHDKITTSLQDIAKLKEKLKGIKKDIKAEELIDADAYLEMKKVYKDLRKQIKDFEEDYLAELKESDFYNELREMKIKAEEDIAHANEELYKNIAELPQKAFNMQVDTEAGPIRVDVQPEMQLYLNGKEHRRHRAI